MTTRPDPVPAALFEAAVMVLRGGYTSAELARVEAVRTRDENWIQDTAERLIRQAVAGGVREEGAG